MNLLLNPKYENERRQNDNTAAVVYGGIAVDCGGGDCCGVGAAFEPETVGRILCGSAWDSELPRLWGIERLFAAAGVVVEAVTEKGNHWEFEDNTAKQGLTVPPLFVKKFLQKKNGKHKS